jgi:nucleoside-diphosphate-sugar epimerase
MQAEPARIVITGGAGLVGQNLVLQMRERGWRLPCVLDRSASNLRILRELNPGIETVEADLAETGAWQEILRGADTVVVLHAQIGGVHESAYTRNNLDATQNVLDALRENPSCHVVHASTSAVNSLAEDWYVRTKREQEHLVSAAPNPLCVLRPTLMFGWFDRKHLGWLSRFMQHSPVFPVPGSGEYLRQPLYAADFCRVVLACIEGRRTGFFNISGKEKIAYGALIEAVRAACGARTWIVHVPVALFRALLQVYALFDRDPPFTARQLDALIIDELFEDSDWEREFGLRATPLAEAIAQTFGHARYSSVELQF